MDGHAATALVAAVDRNTHAINRVAEALERLPWHGAAQAVIAGCYGNSTLPVVHEKMKEGILEEASVVAHRLVGAAPL